MAVAYINTVSSPSLACIWFHYDYFFFSQASCDPPPILLLPLKLLLMGCAFVCLCSHKMRRLTWALDRRGGEECIWEALISVSSSKHTTDPDTGSNGLVGAGGHILWY
jgi:hypothetical protein